MSSHRDRVPGGRRVRRLAVGLVLGLASGLLSIGALQAQEAEDERDGVFVDSVEVNVVTLDVTVTDRDGNPVTDLEKDDFRVWEDGEEVRVTNFTRVIDRRRVDGSGARTAATEADPAPETPVTADPDAPPHEKLYLVLYVDNLHIHPFSRNRVFGNLRQLLRDTVREGDRVMLVSHDRSAKVRVPFTTDVLRVTHELFAMEKESGLSAQREEERRIALEEIDAMNTEQRALMTAHRFAESEYFDVEGTIDRLRELIDTIGGLRGRKAIVYVSEGVPMVAGEDLFYAVNEKFRTAGAISEARGYDLSRDFTSLANLANSNRVTFFTLDAAGLRTTSTSDLQQRTVIRSTLVDSQNIKNLQGSIVLLARHTGGRVARDTNDFGPFMSEIDRTLGSYYSLGYPATHAGDGRYRRLKVEVGRKGVEVHHRRGYRDVSTAERMRSAAVAALHFEESDNPLGVGVRVDEMTLRDEGNYSVPLVVLIPYDRVVMVPHADSHDANLRLFLVAMDGEASTSAVQEMRIPMSVPAEQREEARGKVFPFRVPLVMAEGEQRLTLAIRDDYAGTESYLTVRFDVGGDP